MKLVQLSTADLKRLTAKQNATVKVWDFLSEYVDMPLDFISEHKSHINWLKLVGHRKLPESFLREHINIVKYTDQLSIAQDLSNQFIQDYASVLNWFALCRFQALDEETVLLNENMIFWNVLFENENAQLSEEFVKAYQYKVHEDKTTMNVSTMYVNYQNPDKVRHLYRMTAV